MFGKGDLLGEGVLIRGCLGEGVLGEEEKHRKIIEEYDTNMGIIQGQKGVFRKGVFKKGGVLGEGVLGRGCLGEGVLGEEEKYRKTIEEYDANMGIIQGQKRVFRKGVFRKGGVLGEGVLGEEEKYRKTIGVRMLHQHGYNPGPEEDV